MKIYFNAIKQTNHGVIYELFSHIKVTKAHCYYTLERKELQWVRDSDYNIFCCGGFFINEEI